MCGRMTLGGEGWTDLQRHFPFEVPPGLETARQPRYNIAPTDWVWAVERTADGRREVSAMRWGLPVPWGPAGRAGLINARCETVFTKPTFRQAAESGRVLILADGYYEWRLSERQKLPYRMVDQAGRPLLLAGISQLSGAEAAGPRRLAVVTRPAVDALAAIHARMPLILEPHDALRWLDASVDALAAWSRPDTMPEPPPLTAYRVSPRVNRSRIDEPSLIAPVAP